VNEVTRERAQSFLTDDHMKYIVATSLNDHEVDGFARFVSTDEIRTHDYNLSIPLYVQPKNGESNSTTDNSASLAIAIDKWRGSSAAIRSSVSDVMNTLKESGLGS
jgi:type I restriction enzyme M protein